MHLLRQAQAWSRAERLCAAAVALAGLALLFWAWRVWPEWRDNPDLSHGFFALPILVLLWRRAAEERMPVGGGLGGLAQAGLVLPVGLALLGAALFTAVYVVAYGWSATPSLFLVGSVAAGSCALATALAAGRAVRWIAPGWPALVLPLVVLLSSPLPPGTYQELTLALQEGITVGVVETLRLVGIPAMREGNVIHLGATSVGVEEACSGMRSLVSCVLAGLVLSALLLRSPGRRAVLVIAAAPLALVTNFLRSLALTLLARNGVDIAGAWHDGLGFAVLGVTTALLGWIAVTLEEGELAPARAEAPAKTVTAAPGGDTGGTPARRERLWPALASGWSLACLALVIGWLGFMTARTGSADPADSVPPVLARIIPERPADASWTVSTRGDLELFADALQTDLLLEREYVRRGADGRPVQFTVYAAWWPAGASSVSSVAAHTPEACWPGSGWVLDPAASERRGLALADGRVAAEAEQRLFRRAERPQRVWYWHLVDGAPLRPFEPSSWRDQLRLFLEKGARREAPQAFVRLSSNRDWSELAGEPLVAEVLEGLAELGLPLVRPE